MEKSKRSSGVLLHITSLPNKYTLGTFSCEAYKFIDWLVAGGFKVWQILPITDCGYSMSPYSAMSSFAINPSLIDLSEYLSDKELASFDFDKTNTASQEESKINSALDLIYTKYGKTLDISEFEKKNKSWLDNYALYKVIKTECRNVSWREFPAGLRNKVKSSIQTFVSHTRKKFIK